MLHGFNCDQDRIFWLLSEYKEPKIDWSKIKVDTKILVSNDSKEWFRRYFAGYENYEICAFAGGNTSWSNGGLSIESWEYAKLAEEE